jgi:integrase
MRAKRNQPAGIRVRHSRSCSLHTAEVGRCNCTPSVEAFVYSKRDRRKVRKTFSGKGALAAAKAWRADLQSAAYRGKLRAPTQKTLSAAADELLAGMRDGTIRPRRRGKNGGGPYKPSAVRSYERALRLRVLPEFGECKLGALARLDLQDFADRLLADGLDASTIRNTIIPLQVIYRRAKQRDEIAVDPTEELELPGAQGTRDRIAPPTEAETLLAALSDDDRAAWATALFAGLRRGELRALRWSDIDLPGREIHVVRAWDDVEGPIAGKSAAAERTVPIIAVLAPILAQHKLRTGRAGDALVFGISAGLPFDPSSLRRRAYAAWGWREATVKGKRQRVKTHDEALEPIGLHEARHPFASLMIAAGVNPKALSTFMGHASIQITIDRYGHLMPGGRDEARAAIDAYLERLAARPNLRAVGGES